MRRRVWLLFLSFVIYLPSESVTTQQFEGIVDITITTPSYEDFDEMESVVQRYYVKEPLIRIEIQGSISDVVILVDKEQQELYVLDQALQRYTKNTFDEYAEEDAFSKTELDFSVHTTDQKKTILGFETQLIEFIAEGEVSESFDKIEVWVTPELNTLYGELFFAMMDKDAAENTWQAILINQNLFPLQTNTYYDNAILEKSEVTLIESRSLDKDLFAIPENYREVDHRKQ